MKRSRADMMKQNRENLPNAIKQDHPATPKFPLTWIADGDKGVIFNIAGQEIRVYVSSHRPNAITVVTAQRLIVLPHATNAIAIQSERY